ncbi:hypothetical protein KY363_03805, partial [Candidatus Woesearchaeota archaeon]|nr:hypothetical protein [Candidatus Woesearchaeota archaeon]
MAKPKSGNKNRRCPADKDSTTDSSLTALVRKDKPCLPETKPLSIVEYTGLRQEFGRREEDGTYGLYVDRYSSTDGQKPQNTALLLHRRNVLVRQGEDSLESLRKSMGLDAYREQLVEAIAENISFEKGLESLIACANRHAKSRMRLLGIDRAASLKDIGRIAPEITSAEIAWLSAVQAVPSIYFQDSGGVPTILDFSMHGIEFGYDGLNPFEMTRDCSMDAYAEAGITGKRENSLVVPFNREFEKAFEKLALLILSDAFIYKNMIEEHAEECLIKGDGKLKRAVLRDQHVQYGIDSTSFARSTISDLVSSDENSLSASDLTEVEKKIHSILANKTIYDFAQEVILSERAMVTLAGMLKYVPGIFLDETEFSGYVIPFGKGVKIVDSAGDLVEYVPYEPFVQLSAQENTHYTIKDFSRTNEMISFMFESYANRVEADVPISDELPADKLREAFRQRYHISIPPRSVKTIRPPKNEYEQLTMKGDKKLLEYTLKIGCTEASVLLAQLDKLP